VRLVLLSVKDATGWSSLTTPVAEERRLRHRVNVVLSSGVPLNAVHPPTMGLLTSAFRRCWRLRWDDHYKETFWRLTVDGLPSSQRLHLQGGPGCPCAQVGWEVPDRLHHFWRCSVADAVRGAISASLGSPVTRHQLWLMEASPAINQGVWCVCRHSMPYGARARSCACLAPQPCCQLRCWMTARLSFLMLRLAQWSVSGPFLVIL